MTVLKQIKEYDGYFCDESGNIYRMVKPLSCPDESTDKIIINNKRISVNRLVYMAWFGEVSKNEKVVRLNINKPATPDNLKLANNSTSGGGKKVVDECKILKLYEEGVSPAKIAERLGIQPPTVTNITKRLSNKERRYEYNV